MIEPRPATPRILGLLAAASVGIAGVAQPQVPAVTTDSGRSDGIWKAAVPAKPMRGEFDDFDPLGVAAGAKIKADCSLNWINPDDGKLYCFSSGTSLEFFLDKPQTNLERARIGWRKLAAEQK